MRWRAALQAAWSALARWHATRRYRWHQAQADQASGRAHEALDLQRRHLQQMRRWRERARR